MAAWGVTPPDVAQRFSEEALVELVPAMLKRRLRESTSYQLAQVAKALPGSGVSSQPGARDGAARVHTYPSGRKGRTYGSAAHPLTGAELEAALHDIARHESSRNVRVH